MNKGIIFLLLVLAVTLGLVDGFRKCKLGQKYVQKGETAGRCKRCRNCRAGKEIDTSVNLTITEQYGYMQCYPCVKCKKGYYRIAGSKMTSCSKCGLDCSILKRYQDENCGGTRSGHCGDCMLGYTARSRDRNTFCSTTTTVATPITKPMSIPTTSTASPPVVDMIRTQAEVDLFSSLDGNEQTKPTNEQNIAAGSTIGVICLLGAVIGVIIWRCKNRNRNTNDNQQPTTTRKVDQRYRPRDLVGVSASKVGLLYSNGSSLGQDNDLEMNAGGDKETKQRGELPENLSKYLEHSAEVDVSKLGLLERVGSNLGRDNDLEIDAGGYYPGGAPNPVILESDGSNLGQDNDQEAGAEGHLPSQHPGELQLSLTDYQQQPECISPTMISVPQDVEQTNAESQEHHTRKVTKDDTCLDIISKNVYGERVNEFFRYLKVGLPKIEPEKEMWLNGKHDYPAYILQVLIKWIMQEGKAATFDKLYSALKMADFTEALEKLDKNVHRTLPKEILVNPSSVQESADNTSMHLPSSKV